MTGQSDAFIGRMENVRVIYGARPAGTGRLPPQPWVVDSGRYPDRRKHPQLTNLIDDYLAKGWVITDRNPLTIRRGKAGWQLRNWCLSSL